MADTASASRKPGTVVTPPAPPPPPPPPRRGPGHRGADIRDTVAEMAAKAQEISMEAGSKMAAAMKDVINAAAGLSAFAIESARDLVQYMVRRGQMTQEEADKLIREVQEAQSKRKGRTTAKAAARSGRAAGAKPPRARAAARPAKAAKHTAAVKKAGLKKAAPKKAGLKKAAPKKAAPKKPTRHAVRARTRSSAKAKRR